MMCMDKRCDHEHWVARFGHEVGMNIHGNVSIGERVSLCAPLDINAKDSRIVIGDDCDIAAFVSITTADSHLRCLGVVSHIDRRPITIEHHVFVGQGAIILGGATIGHHSVIGAGVVVQKRAGVGPYELLRAPEPSSEELPEEES